MEPEPPADVDRARELLDKARLNNHSELMLAGAQVHAALAVEQAAREMIRLALQGRLSLMLCLRGSEFFPKPCCLLCLNEGHDCPSTSGREVFWSSGTWAGG